MKITRMIDGKPVQFELTTSELTSAYYEKQRDNDKDWISWLLNDYGYDTDRMEEDLVYEIADRYRSVLESGDGLGEAEHNAFESIIDEFDCPLLEEEEEEAV